MPSPRSTLPPLNALRAFEVAGRRVNFRAASEELGVTQGAVAQQIRLLEDHLGQLLFTRLPRGLALTARGAAFHAEVSRAFGILREATAQLDTGDGSLTISVTPTFATRLLIPHLSALGTAFPDVEIRTIATVTVSDLDRDQVDIAVREGRPPFPDTIDARLLFRQDLVMIGSPHLLGPAPHPLDPAELRKFPLLHDAYDHWTTYFGTDGKLPGARFNQISLALDAAVAGQGLAIACRAFVQADLEAGRLIEAGPAGYDPDTGYYLIRKRSSQPRATLDAVWDWCLDTFSVTDPVQSPGPT